LITIQRISQTYCSTARNDSLKYSGNRRAQKW